MIRASFALVVLCLQPIAAAAESLWIPVVAHQEGYQKTQWRSDVSVLNLCEDRATVTLVLRTDEGEFRKMFFVAGSRQQLFEDVVWQLLGGPGTGSLEVLSSTPVSVSSRTYTLGLDGSYGQSLVGVRTSETVSAGAQLSLQQLRQDAGFRTNLGVLNTGSGPAAVSIRLFDRLGYSVGSFELAVSPGATVQDTRPYLDRFGRSDIAAGYAVVQVLAGEGIWAYASVVDTLTGDPTTVTPEPMPACPVDIADQLAAIPGLVAVEAASPVPGYRYFVLHFEQPADHDDPEGERFQQYLTLLHRDGGTPMVMYTAGYYNWVGNNPVELTRLLGANQLAVEHRFFGSSTPASGDWSLLTIKQAAADHHRIVQALKPLYSGAWVTTGASKGGMTATYHRRFYPDDVEATVPYVAPISFAAPDARYVDFVATRGAADCRQALTDLQREALGRRDTLVPMLADWAARSGYGFDRVGGAEAAFEAVVLELPFTFWQYSGAAFCASLPTSEASDAVLFNALGSYSSFWYPTDDSLDYYAAYFYQAHTQLGFPDVARDHLSDLLQTDALNLEAGLPPVGTEPVYDGGAAMQDIADWVASEGERLLFIYGENDPWTAGAYELDQARDSHIFAVANGTHGADIEQLSAADRAAVSDILERWTGVRPSTKDWQLPEKVEQRGRWRR